MGCLKGDVEVEIYADASFGNYIGLKDREGNTCPIIWKSRVAKRLVGSIVKHIWEEVNNT